MTISDLMQAAVAIATFVLAVAAFATIIVTHRQHQDQMRKLVMPFLVPHRDANVLFPEPIISALKHEAVRDMRPENWLSPVYDVKAFQLQNVGNGPALWVQWEVNIAHAVGFSPSPSVPRSHTYLLRLDPGARAPLWHTRDSGSEGMEIADGLQITTWHDDILGNHYRCVFERHGTRWLETYRGRERTRPPLFDSSLGL